MMKGRKMKRRLLIIVFALLCLSKARATERAESVLERIGAKQGICVLVGDTNCDLSIALAGRSELTFYVQLARGRDVGDACRAADEAGLFGTRIFLGKGSPAKLHLADNIADALVFVNEKARPSREEALRILRPGGKAFLGDRALTKPFPEGMDDWTHPYHGPDNNPVSEDRLIRAPYMTQFLADPRYGPAPQLAVASAGRVFKAFGHVAWHEREEAFLNTLAAFNGFNGTMLWKRPLPEGLMVHRNTMIATPEMLYVGDDKSCKLVDTATGRSKGEIVPPIEVAGGTFWKWMALEDGTLYAVIGEPEQVDETMRWKRQAHGWPWTGISKGYNQREQPWGFGRNLLAINPETKKVLWRHHEDEPMDGRAVCMKNGRIFVFRFGTYLTCLDAKTGKVLWRKAADSSPELFKSLGGYLPRQSWQTNWRTTVYLKCSDRALYFAGPQIGKLLAVSAEDGRILWEHPYDNFQLILHPDGLYAISGPWANNLSKKFDPLTGRILAEFPTTGRRACTRPTSTSDSILFRAMGGSVRFDLASSSPRWLSPMRPACHDGVTVANGLLYWWPFACDCQLTLNGFTCTGPAGDFDFTPEISGAERLEKRRGRTEPSEMPAATDADWPTFRANNQRTTASGAVVPAKGNVLWRAKSSVSSGVRPTAPVAVGGFVLLAGSDGVVRALDSDSGRELWKAYTGGEIRIPPTIWKGRALVGSGDGWVYTLDVATGKILWRFRAAPAERKIPVYGKLLSTWPAASGVLVEDDVAYVAAGLVNYDGTYVYALDPATGDVKWCNDTSGHLDPEANCGVSAQGHLLLNDNKLYLAGGNAVSPGVYDVRDGRCLSNPAPLAKCESTSPRGWELSMLADHVVACGKPFYAHPAYDVYDRTVFSRVFMSSVQDTAIVWASEQNEQHVMGLTDLDRRGLSRKLDDPGNCFHVSWGRLAPKATSRWSFDCRKADAVAVCRNAVVVATESKLVALNPADGSTLWQRPLPKPVVPWGLAVDHAGRVIAGCVDGTVLCFGGQRVRQASL